MKEDGVNQQKNWKKTLWILLSILIVVTIFILVFFLWPRIKLNGSSEVKINYKEKYKEQGAYAVYFAKKDKKVKISGEVNEEILGKYKITYKYKFGVFNLTKVRTINVIDEEKPKITLVGDDTVLLCPSSEYKEFGYLAIDNYDGDITDKVKVSVDEEKQVVKYQVSDSSNNKNIIKRKYSYADDAAPVITLNGNSDMTIYVNQSYVEPGYQVIDNCDGDIAGSVLVEGSVDSSKVGEYTLLYKAIDKSGNESSMERKVKVVARSSLNSGGEADGTIYLTFDDGPSATITPNVLDILKEENIKATFFVINHNSSLDYLIKRINDEGHTIALHSYTHKYNLIYQSVDSYFNDLKQIHDKVQNITGVDSKIIRFPGGGSNTVSKKYSVGIMSYLTSEVLNRGYRYYDWNVSSGDAGEASNASEVYNNVVNGLKHNKTNIILMHDFENNYKTLDALRDIIHFGKNNGYEFSSINMSTPMVRHRVNN